MWVYLPWGFFSIIKITGDSYLTVRSRISADLDELRKRYLPELGPTISTPERDYSFRAVVTPEAFSIALSKIAMDINYSNVKAETMSVSGLKRELVYARVHTTTTSLENIEPYGLF